MTSSMTAFARQQSEHDWGTLVWEIRSVNHRYLEPTFRLPDSLRHLEVPLRELLRARLQRGKVEAQLKLVCSASVESGISINHALLQELCRATEEVRERFADCGALNPLEILKWPGLVVQHEQDTKLLEEKTLELFAATVEALQQQREREGTQLRQLIEDRLTQIDAIVAEIRGNLPGILAAQ
ncbi:MAG TPA: YicC/YloC family endoribonuclease, partial [Hyphomicrobiales bacterium]|nr:YicC/YloC family endoribonuclease [Hyphomicrobiales bacterium]